MRTCAHIYAIISPSAIRKVNVCTSMSKIVQAERRAKLAWALLRRGRCSRRSLKERLIFESRRQKYSKFSSRQWPFFRLSRNLSSFRLLVQKSVQLLAFSPSESTRKTQKQIFSPYLFFRFYIMNKAPIWELTHGIIHLIVDC